MQEERFAIGPAADDWFGEHSGDDYGALGAALGAAARRVFEAVEGLKGGGGGEMSVAEMRQKLEQSANSTSAKSLLARHMSMFEVVSESVKRRGLLGVGTSEQVRACFACCCLSMFEVVSESVKRRGVLGTGTSEQVRSFLFVAVSGV